MEIKKTEQFKYELKHILEYIVKDKITAMKTFRKELDLQINDLINFLKKYRKSIYTDNQNIRDMVFKGYTIIYKIYKNEIVILTIFNQNLPDIK